jgi:alpha-1,6-mannosyltransferase
VHPWYVINLILLSVFTKYKFPIVWSFFIILSYFAYSQIPFQENYGFLFIEYFAVFAIFILEIKNIDMFSLKNKSLQI